MKADPHSSNLSRATVVKDLSACAVWTVPPRLHVLLHSPNWEKGTKKIAPWKVAPNANPNPNSNSGRFVRVQSSGGQFYGRGGIELAWTFFFSRWWMIVSHCILFLYLVSIKRKYIMTNKNPQTPHANLKWENNLFLPSYIISSGIF